MQPALRLYILQLRLLLDSHTTQLLRASSASVRAFCLAFLAFGPSDFQLHLYGPYISICATCELGYSPAVCPKQLTVTAQEYFTKKSRAAKGCQEDGRDVGVGEVSPSLLSSNFNDSRRCLLFFQSISIKLASASG